MFSNRNSEVAAKTDVGCVRTNNEDCFGYDVRIGVFVVCDGMGGQAAGEVASRIAVDTILDHCRTAARATLAPREIEQLSESANHLARGVQLANRAIRAEAERSLGQMGMGSTVVVAALTPNSAAIAHVGDSRVYLVRQGAIQQLTADHSLVMEHVRSGLISPEQARTSELQNVLLRALGADDNLEPDVADFSVLAGDVLLLCTDGLTGCVDDTGILQLITSAKKLQLACDALIDAAKAAGGRDNVTVVLIRVLEQPWYSKLVRA